MSARQQYNLRCEWNVNLKNSKLVEYNVFGGFKTHCEMNNKKGKNYKKMISGGQKRGIFTNFPLTCWRLNSSVEPLTAHVM